MHSLVNVPVLGFDLARRPRGEEVADVLLSALALRPANLDRLAGTDDATAPGLATAALAGGVGRELTVRTVLGADAGRGAPVAALGARLEQAAIGTAEGLVRLLRDDVLAWAGPTSSAAPAPRDAVVESFCCGVLAGYLHRELPVEDVAALSRPWTSLRRRLPEPQVDLGPGAAAVERVLECVAGLVPDDVDDVLAVHEVVRARADWVAAMHEATWAAYLSGRLRPAAAAQLRLVATIRGTGAAVRASVAGAWAPLSGLVQSLVVADLLGDAEGEVLAACRPVLDC